MQVINMKKNLDSYLSFSKYFPFLQKNLSFLKSQLSGKVTTIAIGAGMTHDHPRFPKVCLAMIYFTLEDNQWFWQELAKVVKSKT